MTPAVNLLNKNKIQFKILTFEHDKQTSSYGKEAVKKLDEDSLKIFKARIVRGLSSPKN